MKIITINGTHKTGKTTTAIEIIKELTKRGFSVGSVKEIHAENFAIDTPGTNTDLHKRAGSDMVIARGLFETDILIPRALNIEQILDYFHHDWVICEGVEDANALKIVTGITKEDCLSKWDDRVIAVSGVFSNNHQGEFCERPVFHPVNDVEEFVNYLIKHVKRRLPSMKDECCRACNMTCHQMLIEQFLHPEKELDCVLKDLDVNVLIDEKPLNMVPFVKQIIKNNILAVVSELDGYYPHKSITVTIGPYEIKKK